MIEITDTCGFEKTGFYEPKNALKKIYYDKEMQSIVMGLIKFSLDSPTENEKVFKKVYDFVDERRYLIELTPQIK